MPNNLIRYIKTHRLTIINFILLMTVTLVLIFNQVLMARIQIVAGVDHRGLLSKFQVFSLLGNSFGSTVKLSGDLSDDSMKLVLSTGVPEIYGSEMGIDFDHAATAMDMMRQYDPDSGRQAISLTHEEMTRYKNIAGRISCEYCCGAKSIIFSDGRSACSCDHAKAMRGLTAYLLRYHPNELNNDEVLRELARWKGRYFPKQMTKKMYDELQSGSYTPDIAALLLDVDLPTYGQGDSRAPLPSDINNMPDMVGDC